MHIVFTFKKNTSTTRISDNTLFLFHVLIFIELDKDNIPPTTAAQTSILSGIPESVMCVQRFDEVVSGGNAFVVSRSRPLRVQIVFALSSVNRRYLSMGDV